MTIIEAITKVDTLKHNTFEQSDKIAWLSNLDTKVKKLIIDRHEGSESVVFEGYDVNTDLNTKLLAPAPFDEMYLRWLEAQINYHNDEIERYNASITLFNTAYEAFYNHYNRTHMPRGRKITYF